MRRAAWGLTAAVWAAAGPIRSEEAPVSPSPVPTPPPVAANAAPPNTLTDEEKAQGWVLLFDGKTTAGWRGFKKEGMPDGWKVEEGALVRAGGGGDIVTVDAYANFELRLEWKIAEGGNSGILYRVSEDEGTPWATGPEMQILDNARNGDAVDPLRAAGACCGLYAPSKDVTRPAGQWNQVRLLVDGARVEHGLNGETICTYTIGSEDWLARVAAASQYKALPRFGKNPSGLICLQDHGDRVEFRSIKIRVIKTGP